ncbi:TadE family protein [Variovorax sp. J22G40]|uniref:TadE/TadG family type IV pilus assembly protein n=1 Tax=Variovorax sp. J22G40 TaxID=3053505 RepID=UPI003365956F
MKRIRIKIHQQQGIAAIEFALIFTALILFPYGISTFGMVLYTQHMLTRAAEDGARVVVQFNNVTEGQVRATVLESMSAPWKDSPGLQVTSPMNTNPVIVTITYPYSANALLPRLPFTANWMIPDTLRAHATVTKPSL